MSIPGIWERATITAKISFTEEQESAKALIGKSLLEAIPNSLTQEFSIKIVPDENDELLVRIEYQKEDGSKVWVSAGGAQTKAIQEKISREEPITRQDWQTLDVTDVWLFDDYESFHARDTDQNGLTDTVVFSTSAEKDNKDHSITPQGTEKSSFSVLFPVTPPLSKRTGYNAPIAFVDINGDGKFDSNDDCFHLVTPNSPKLKEGPIGPQLKRVSLTNALALPK